MIEKTQGIVLRFVPFSETSRMVTWLTLSHGKIATSMKGAQRPRSSFLGQYDLFYTCEILFYTRGKDDVHIAKECAPLKLRTGFRTNWKAAASASYLAHLTSKISPASAPHPELFLALDQALDNLSENGASASYLYWFELKLLEALGHAPNLNHCLMCRKEILKQEGQLGVAYKLGGFVCATCMKHQMKNMPTLSRGVLATLSGWQRAKSKKAMQSTKSTPQQLAEIGSFLGRFMSYHLDISLTSRDIALQTINYEVLAATKTPW